ncbi:cyclopropane-fatty-acyl-phospholipid synthase [Candidatus Parcubacteria bacterium]|nr:MAG: cyclopropane-fatty-acyl-phospholipid synthase [Candidatus Parcubacteria bacterium]
MNIIFKKIFLSFFANKSFVGRLEIADIDNKKYVFGEALGASNMPRADIKIIDSSFYKKVVLYGDIGLGEAYFLGYFETADLKILLKWFIDNQENMPSFQETKNSSSLFEWAKIPSRFFHYLNKNTKKGSKRNIKKHYDVSNDFYKLWLDETMTYSSAIFLGDESLYEGQINKYERICEKLGLRESDTVLEIGSGWGGFSIYAAKKYGCKIKTVTISQEQYDYTREKITKEGLDSKIEILLQDYRDLKGDFDKIVSIEMMEALGHEFVPLFVNKCNELLRPGGKICYQCITFPDKFFKKYLKDNNYIKKHIFPGGELISLGNLKDVLEETRLLKIMSVESIGIDYAKTLRKWRKNLLDKKDKVFSIGFDEEFIKKWLYYFYYCEVGFEEKYLEDVQILIEKKTKEANQK